MNIVKELEGLRVKHHYCGDDPYYSCPKSGDSSCETKESCDCGADYHNEKLDSIIGFFIISKSCKGCKYEPGEECTSECCRHEDSDMYKPK